MEDDKKKYEDALERCKKEFNFNNLAYSHEEIKQRLERVFPELKNNEDEKIRKEIVSFLRTGEPCYCPNTVKRQNWANWLEKQGEQKSNPYSGTSFEYNGHIWGMCARDNGVDILLDKQLFKHLENQGEQKPLGKPALEVWKDMRLEVYQQASGNRHESNYSDDSTKMFSLTDIDEIFEKVAEKQCEESNRLYVRFGEIPEDECSGVYHAGELVGKEEGVSVYNAKIDNHNNVLICIPLPINKNTLDTFQNLVEYDNRNCYLVKGTCVGKGSDNEPIIRNVSIVKRIDNYRIKESDKKSDKNLDNFCKTCKDEQKPTDKVEPKFKVGDWIVQGKTIAQILDIQEQYYVGLDIDGNDFTSSRFLSDDKIHLWTIQDAKDGDVLAVDWHEHNDSWEKIIIFKKYHHNGVKGLLSSPCVEGYGNTFKNGKLVLSEEVPYFSKTWTAYLHPATKEQCDLLFQKMKEAGYTFDFEKKELKKIEQKPEIKDDVLSRFAFYQYDDDTIYLSSLFVRESDRGRGYGSKVLKAAEEVAKTFGISKIRLKVERNTWMEEWYEKNGYEYLSSEGKYDWLENRAIDIKPDKIEQKPDFCHHEVDFSNCSEEYRKAYYDGWNNCNQQHAQLEAEQKPTWSEEDEEMIDAIIADIQFTQKAHTHEVNQVVYEREIDWLKSIKERYTWKPSDEQMEALYDAVKLYKSQHFDSYHYKIESLYEDLKKLKGE